MKVIFLKDLIEEIQAYTKFDDETKINLNEKSFLESDINENSLNPKTLRLSTLEIKNGIFRKIGNL